MNGNKDKATLQHPSLIVLSQCVLDNNIKPDNTTNTLILRRNERFRHIPQRFDLYN